MIKPSVFYILVSILIVFIISLFVTLKAKAVDLGTFGNSFAIKEDDLQEHLIKKLDSLDQDKLAEYQKAIANQTVQSIKKPKAVKGISKANKYGQRFFDPTFVVGEDIYSASGKLLYAKGSKLNPLEYKDFNEVWILIDGDDQLQVNFAKKYNPEKSLYKKIILVNGNPGLQEDGSFYYFDQAEEISKKLSITKVPSIVRQINGRNDISIEEIEIDEQEVAKEKQGVAKK